MQNVLVVLGSIFLIMLALAVIPVLLFVVVFYQDYKAARETYKRNLEQENKPKCKLSK